MQLKHFTLAIVTILLSLYSSAQISFASSVSFDIKSNVNEAKLGEEIEVTITGQDVKDLYGYEMELEFDPSMLQFKKATSGISNLIYPITTTDNSSLLLVSTKVGDVKGSNGDVTLGKIIFQVIGEGKDVGLKLNKIKLAASTATSTSHNVLEQIQVQLTKGSAEKPTIVFTDITGHWAEANIIHAVELGFIQGYRDDTFRPNKEVSRAEFAVMVYGALSYPMDSEAWLGFSDQDQMAAWSRTAISSLTAEGIINGYKDGTFRPSQSILRSEMAVMMASILKLEVKPTDRSTFNDTAKMMPWAEPSIAAVAQKGLLQGRGNNMFNPNGLVTRAEAVQVIISMLDYMKLPTELGS